MLKQKLIIEIDVHFHGYQTKALNKKACAQIKKWIREGLREAFSFIPLYVEKSESGSVIEDRSAKTKITIKAK